MFIHSDIPIKTSLLKLVQAVQNRDSISLSLWYIHLQVSVAVLLDNFVSASAQMEQEAAYLQYTIKKKSGPVSLFQFKRSIHCDCCWFFSA